MTLPDKPVPGPGKHVQTLYQIEISREHSGDFLEEIRALTFLAQVRSDALELQELGEGIPSVETEALGRTSVRITATDPGVLLTLSNLAEDRGYELPDPEKIEAPLGGRPVDRSIDPEDQG